MMVRYIVRNSHAMSFENARLKMNGQIIPLRCFPLDELIENMQLAREKGIKTILDAVINTYEDARCGKACNYPNATPKDRDDCTGKILSSLFAGIVSEADLLPGDWPSEPPYLVDESILSLAQKFKSMDFEGTQHSDSWKCVPATKMCKTIDDLLANLPEVVTSEDVVFMKSRAAKSGAKSVWDHPESCPLPASQEQALREGWLHDQRFEKAYNRRSQTADSSTNPIFRG
ncbi:hypothetical protein LTS18_010689 [Coniosporium uncinatum]|uniref:Uncharacterized protein n=1 Tax=Coniosporium uncinatum TaxID=93489 RepID=A0ACC3DLC5_9PEZI|nr:hypothetical protein LTS18_010689 [Coniosporium uncinatum]